jgi:hypothetical protein
MSRQGQDTESGFGAGSATNYPPGSGSFKRDFPDYFRVPSRSSLTVLTFAEAVR